MVSCDVAGGITLGTKMKMVIFTLYLPHNLQSRVSVFQKFMQLIGIYTILNKTYQNFPDKDWSDQEVNIQIDKDFNP